MASLSFLKADRIVGQVLDSEDFPQHDRHAPILTPATAYSRKSENASGSDDFFEVRQPGGSSIESECVGTT